MVAKGICVMLVEIVVAGKRSIVKGRSPRYGPVWQFDRIPGGACRIDIALYQVVARPYIPHLYVWQSEGRIDRPLSQDEIPPVTGIGFGRLCALSDLSGRPLPDFSFS